MALAQFLHGSYFAIENPIRLLDRWLNSYCHDCRVRLGEKELLVKWSARAGEALAKRSEPLIIEMQLYFSCVVKKRVIFHDQVNFETLAVNDRIQIAFRSIKSAKCDPQEFARNYPAGGLLESPAAAKMIPSWLGLDFRQGQWQAEFGYKAPG
jgi:hypothetical protein